MASPPGWLGDCARSWSLVISRAFDDQGRRFNMISMTASFDSRQSRERAI